MTYTVNDENNTIRVVIDCLGYERDKIDLMLSSLLCDYKKSYDVLKFERDPESDQGKARAWYMELYVRLEDRGRLERLLKRV